MHRSLRARQLLFDGISQIRSKKPDERLARQSLSLFRQSLELEPQSPLPWSRMSIVYVAYLQQPDSAFACAREACNLAPNWVLPFTDLSFYLIEQNKLDLAQQALQVAEAIDSLHLYFINCWALCYGRLDDLANKEKAVALFEKYRESGGVLYPWWHGNYGLLLRDRKSVV